VKSDDKRDALLDSMADFVLTHGLGAASLRPLAKAAGLSDRMLLYYFKDKDELIAAILARIVARLTDHLNAQDLGAPMPVEELADRLLPILLAPAMWPFMCVWLEIAALAGRGDSCYRQIGGQIGAGFLAWGSMHLDSAMPAQKVVDARHLLVLIEGQIVLKSLGM
jgi:AcrR family transcriptional regulator